MDQFSVVESIFNEAVAIETPSKLDAFLKDRCPDEEIRRKVEQMLAFDANSATLVTNPHQIGNVAPSDSDLLRTIGSRIGPYKIRELIGEGGMGVVYVAEQSQPVRRKVALKIIKPGMDTKEVLARFEAERQALAVMKHPHIATVLDVGASEQGYPYFAMELVRGLPITTYCDQARLTARERLELFVDVCDAVQHAHQKGIIHRDLKPSNVLVTQINGNAVVKVIDFGLAKAMDNQHLTNKSLYTGFMRVMGTPNYMSPEQVGLSGQDVDTRSDIYSLGVLLYEILTGTTPLDSTKIDDPSYENIFRQIREWQPPKPSSRLSTMNDAKMSTIAQQRHTDPKRLTSELRGELDWIVMKALEKDRTRRYETANGLAKDIERYLNNEPVTAVAPSSAYLFRKYVRRHQHVFVTAVAIVGLLFMGMIVSTWLAFRANNAEGRAIAAKIDSDRQRDDAQHARRIAESHEQRALAAERRMRRVLYASDMNLVERELSRGNVGRARPILNRYLPQSDAEDLRGWEWRYLWQLSQSDPHQVLCKVNGLLNSVSASHDGQYVAVATKESVRVWNLLTRTEITSSPFQGRYALFSPAEPLLAYWSQGSGEEADGFRLWNLSTQKVAAILPVDPGIDGLGFSADGRRFAVAAADWGRSTKDRNRIIGWDVASGQRILEADANITGPGAGTPFDITGDWKLAAHGTGDAVKSTIRVIDLDGKVDAWESPPVKKGEWVESIAISPDRKLMAVCLGTVSPEIQIWDLEQKVQVQLLESHFAYVRDLLFLNNTTLASASADRTVRIWNLSDLEDVPEPQILQGHEDEVASLAILPDGNTLVSGGRDGSVFLWDISTVSERDDAHFSFHPHSFYGWAITRDKTKMITCGYDGNVSRWTGSRYETRHSQFHLGEGFQESCVSRDGTMVASGYNDGTVRVWDVATQKIVQEFHPGDGSVRAAGFLGDDKIIRIIGENQWSLWDWANRKVIRTWPNTDVFRPMWEGKTCIYSFEEGAVYSALSGHTEERLPRRAAEFWLTALSNGGRFSAQNLDVWDLQTRTKLGTFGRFMKSVQSVTFSPDEKRLVASSGSFEAIKIWDLESQQELLTLPADGGPLRDVHFTAGGNILSACSEGGVVFCWRAPSWEEVEAAEAERLK